MGCFCCARIAVAAFPVLNSLWIGRTKEVLCAQDHLLEVLRPGLAERVFSDGEYLIRQGDQGTHLLYILEGSVEVLLKLSNPRNDRR